MKLYNVGETIPQIKPLIVNYKITKKKLLKKEKEIFRTCLQILAVEKVVN